eukprot:m.358947 g.358947  ORF g.358947 m.358947 type:complete len:238 (+) comp18352_c0_seq1:28-741(+)
MAARLFSGVVGRLANLARSGSATSSVAALDVLRTKLAASRPTLMPQAASLARMLHTTRSESHYCSRAVWKAQKEAMAKGKAPPLHSDGTNVYGMRLNIKTSPWKLNLVANQIRGLNVDEAIKQMTFSGKKVASHIRQVLVTTKNNAAANHGVADPSNMYVLEAYVGKGRYGRGMRYNSRGRGARTTRPRSHFYLKLREGSAPPPKRARHANPELYTKRLQEKLQTNPTRIRSSLHSA